MATLPSQVIKNPVTRHLPTGALKYGTSYHSDRMVDLRTLASDKPVVFVVGAMAHGKVLTSCLLRVASYPCRLFHVKSLLSLHGNDIETNLGRFSGLVSFTGF